MDIKHLKAFAFDLDGTLSDSIADLAGAANRMRAALGMPPLDQARIQSHVGDGIASLVHRALTDERDGAADPALWEQGYTLFVTEYAAHLCDHTRLYPGVLDGLQLLKTLQLPLAVVTNKSERLAVPLLQKLGIADLFSLVIGGDTLTEKKPSGLPVRHAAAVMGVEASQLGMVGDSVNDVKAARAAGAVAVAVSYGYEDVATLEADVVVDSLAQLYDLMKNG
ncbi:phosphoglycolate phosphatase [Crenobacter intestini]|uniref:Phosphoglycolate phosphatase n=1 Tax=Crenobacter intestini TaxID=2563443 RepID=A0A4T0UMP3_9NEIS|nr:phosphoglycolate phosphatase [Crenobacter intestini]TIC79857.1 phosphoglycolate phosphatase [Crenobacter intestini]